MNYVRVGSRVGAALLITLGAGAIACSSAEPSARGAAGVANMQGAEPPEQDRGWASLVEADREMNALTTMRDQTGDIFVQDAIDHQITSIQRWSDALTDAMTIGDGRVHDADIRQLSANLQRAMSAGVAAEMQADDRTKPASP